MESVVSTVVPEPGLDDPISPLADAAATRGLGRALAEVLIGRGLAEPLASGRPALLLLQGDLGAGKTCLVQGLAEGLGISEPITSPTFALAQHYSGSLPDGTTTRLVHLDLYRLEQAAAADELFAQEEEEAAAEGGAVVMAVEWPERLSFQPAEALLLRLEHEAEGRRVRWLTAAPAGSAGQLLQALVGGSSDSGPA